MTRLWKSVQSTFRAERSRRRRANRLRSRAGYSLLEILIVLAIIALIAALVGPRLFSQLDRSKVLAAKVQAKAIRSALDTLQIDMGRFPSQEEGLSLLVTHPQSADTPWSGPYLGGALPKDPWGHDYVYSAPTPERPEPRVLSYRSDGRPGGTGNAADVASDSV